MPSKKKLQVFVSSTYLDLKDERQSAVEAILKSGHIPAGMELFSAGSESQLETIRRWIDESDVYMLILGGRYGSVDPQTSLSYTELEYDYAVSKEKPLFAVIITESALDEKVRTAGKDSIERERPQELKLFRDKALSRISSFFSDTKDIKLAVHETLSDFMSRYEFTGWVSGTEVHDSSSLIDEISRLHKLNQSLEKKLAEAASATPALTTKASEKRSDEEDFQELFEILKNITIKTSVFSSNSTDENFTLLQIVKTMRDSLVTGIINKVGMSDIHKLLFFNVLPKLETHGMASLEKVDGVQWQRYRLTAKGMRLLAFIDKEKLKASQEKEQLQSSDGPAAQPAT